MCCPKCEAVHIDDGFDLQKAHLWHECKNCGHKFRGSQAAVSTPLPNVPCVTTQVLEYLEALSDRQLHASEGSDTLAEYPEAPCAACHRWSQQRNM